MNRRRLLFWSGLFAFGASSTAAIGQALRPAIHIDDANRKDIVEAAASLLRDGYVDVEKGRLTAETIEAALADGSYGAIDDLQAFADRLTEDMRAVAHDEHLRVIGPSERRPNPGTGVSRADILDGNVGYLKVDAFPQSGAFSEAVSQAMGAFTDTRALIVDVRQNSGGGGTSRLVSYFLPGDEPVLIHTVISRVYGTEDFNSREVWSMSTPVTYLQKPVYVLTSSRTFSAGEGFAYQMQAMGLAKIVGEKTRGGGHNGGTRPLPTGVLLFLPIGRGVNPITETNWEGVGVIPDIPVASNDALEAALEDLHLSPQGSDIEELSQRRVIP